MTLKILTVVGARPQFIKSATISRLIYSEYNEIDEVMVHTGQHYDYNMSQSFFDELNVYPPKYNLEVGSGTHGQQTGVIMSRLEKVIDVENPDWILVYGDTNSTLAASLVAAKKPCRLVHVEAGLRSHRWGMPEEVNRVVTDRLSDLLCCPTVLSKENLMAEKELNKKIVFSGDVMYDSFLHYNNILDHDEVLCKYGLSKKQYVLVTIHRAENTDNKDQLSKILSSLRFISQNMEVILPLHPRTKKMIKEFSISTKGITIVNPISYFSIIALLAYAKVVITDSGGLQKEAYYSKTPCLTIRDETEWVETLENKWNQLVSLRNETDLIDKLEIALKTDYENTPYEYFYGSGNAANIVISSILDYS